MDKGTNAVLATVVALEGSSYRRPGVRMLLLEDGRDFGAVSGGCVEREIRVQAGAVFQTGLPRMMTYDGRYRLGCEGILHILLEPFQPSPALCAAFKRQIRKRDSFDVESYFFQKDGSFSGLGSIFLLEGKPHSLQVGFSPARDARCFRQSLPACMRLVILGGEHDSVELSRIAVNLGWEVIVVVAADESKTIENFPGIAEMKAVIPEKMGTDFLDERSAVLLMTHSYVKDLKYLLRIAEDNVSVGYLGILGPASRRERLLGELLERIADIDPEFLEQVKGPAGIDIGAETAQEIALSILSEILTVFRKVTPLPLSRKKGGIHAEE